jgi:hypothetical protein
MSRRITAHVDLHETSTTSLQESFSTNKETLKELGIFHPSFGLKAHHHAAWAPNDRTLYFLM